MCTACGTRSSGNGIESRFAGGIEDFERGRQDIRHQIETVRGAGSNIYLMARQEFLSAGRMR
jgi:hypothetical protein